MARAQRSRERYHSESTDQERERSLGGFDPRSGPPTASRGIVAAANAALANARTAHAHDWTVVGNVLPMPSDIRRFPRDAINGATEYTSQLIELVAAYLGLQLPFAFVNDAGALTARQCPLWSRSKIPEVSLYLSNSAYDVLTSPSPLSGGPSSLAMSTLSTLESFVQLPGGNHFSWGLASMLGGNAGRNEAGSALQDDAPNKRISASQNQSQARNAAAVSSRAAAIIGGDDPANSAAFNFVQLLTIIAYNAAFIAQKQGVGGGDEPRTRQVLARQLSWLESSQGHVHGRSGL
ncbi:UV radiation resistance protein/autophagy-related protein 14 [Ceraceosorus bombacis]|uniref:Autophagy-related protein 14 n=1 Tax=Ceraceosorus bombacis TaxID=401625 RepID=A0A0P1BGB1_9BASI|nr:UV radiation resistance protein/autophagy-related protein 14 [Ceraceosorus bombacis]